MEQAITLGGNISLIGFKDIDPASALIMNKIVGNYAKAFLEMAKGFQEISITRKAIHLTETSIKHEIYARAVFQGKDISFGSTSPNLFMALDNALKKIGAQARQQ